MQQSLPKLDADLAAMRREYEGKGLVKAEMPADPIEQFRAWFAQAKESGIPEPNAMSLATCCDGEVSCRTVLLKAFDEKGFVFFTNYESRKARQIEANPRVSLLFPWVALARQVEIMGKAERISAGESLVYFLSRPLGSRLSTWVSQQSQVISSRSLLEEQLEAVKRRFANGEIPKPDHWGGYRVLPASIEFWQGGKSRLHDRMRYCREADSWVLERLAP